MKEKFSFQVSGIDQSGATFGIAFKNEDDARALYEKLKNTERNNVVMLTDKYGTIISCTVPIVV